MSNVYQIQIVTRLMRQKPERLTYSTEQEAIDILKEALAREELKFSVEKNANKIRFLNESGGELAAIIKK